MSLLVRMIREEYRLNARLFAGRFAAFPVVITLLVAGGLWLLVQTGTGLETVAAGLHGLVFFFGLQVGTIGLIGRDALRDAIGDVTVLVFSARTLPITWRRLLGTFLLKDLLYYSVLFVGPAAVGYAAIGFTEGASISSLGLLWVTASGAFGLGVALSLTLAGLGTRSRALLLAAVAVVTATILLAGVEVTRWTPYAVYTDPSLETVLTGFLPAVVLAAAGPLLFRPVESGGSRQSPDRYRRVRSSLRDEHGVATRTVLEVLKSSGSVWKVLFSMGVLFGVTALLVEEVASVTTLDPSPGIAFGTLLGMGAFTTYSWVTGFDDAAEYLRYPMSMSTVFAGKRRAYFLLSIPAGLVYLAGAVVWYEPLTLAIGVVVFPLVATYVFGITAYVAGLSPNELLFDTPLFLAFGVALAVLAVPMIVAALAHPVDPGLTNAIAVGLSVLSAVVGVVLARRAGPRWHDRARRRS